MSSIQIHAFQDGAERWHSSGCLNVQAGNIFLYSRIEVGGSSWFNQRVVAKLIGDDISCYGFYLSSV
jgi:hypothetical protein